MRRWRLNREQHRDEAVARALASERATHSVLLDVVAQLDALMSQLGAMPEMHNKENSNDDG